MSKKTFKINHDKPIYILSEKRFYTDGMGWIMAYSEDEDKLIALLKSCRPKAKRSEEEGYWEDNDAQMLYKIGLYDIPFVE